MDAAPSTTTRPHRWRKWAAAVLGAASIVCAATALALTPRGEGAVETFAPAALEVVPSTVAPRAVPAEPPAPARPAGGPSAAQPGPEIAPEVEATVPATSPPSTTLPLSPLNSLLGEAVPAQPVAPLVDVAPVAIAIDSIGVDGVPVRSVGVAADGQLEVPDETEVGWYRLGAAPGQPGTTVLAAHVSWRGKTGPFLRLSRLEPGALVDLDLDDGSVRRYQVVERAQYGKLMLPAEEIWRTNGPETLVLITCGGAFNPDIRRYADNIVVTAVPIA